MGDGRADHEDGSPTRGRNPTLWPKVSQTDIGGWRRRSQYQFLSTSESLAWSTFSSRGRDVHDTRGGNAVVSRMAEFQMHSASDESKLQHGAHPGGPSILTTTASGQNLGWSDIKAWRGSQAYTNDVALQSPG